MVKKRQQIEEDFKRARIDFYNKAGVNLHDFNMFDLSVLKQRINDYEKAFSKYIRDIERCKE